MSSAEIISLVVTFIGVFSFASIFTVLYKSYVTSQIAEIKSGQKDIQLIDEVIYQRQSKIIKKRKIAKIIKDITFYLVLIIIIPLFILSLVNRLQNNVTMIGDKTLMIVASGSMSEKNKANYYLLTEDEDSKLNYQFQKYDIIVLEKVNDESDLILYDVIAFRNDKGINIIHRIKTYEDGQYETRGDANDKSDTYHPTFKDVIGRYEGQRIAGVGVIIMFLQSYSGIITIVSLLYCLLMIEFLTDKINKAQDERILQLEEAIDYKEETKGQLMTAKFVETIYYKGYAYTFNENGFINKVEIKDNDYLEKSNDAIIKEVYNEDSSLVSASQIKIDEEDKGEENYE